MHPSQCFAALCFLLIFAGVQCSAVQHCTFACGKYHTIQLPQRSRSLRLFASIRWRERAAATRRCARATLQNQSSLLSPSHPRRRFAHLAVGPRRAGLSEGVCRDACLIAANKRLFGIFAVAIASATAAAPSVEARTRPCDSGTWLPDGNCFKAPKLLQVTLVPWRSTLPASVW